MAESDGSTKRIELVHDSRKDKTPSPQYLCVDDTKRPRANSDPLGLHIHINAVPEITVTGDDSRSSGRAEDDEGDSFLIPPSPRRRANTCPEDMFCNRKGRPPTPPPTDIRILRGPSGKRFSFNFSPKDISSVSFAHHRLSKVSEEKTEQHQKVTANQNCEDRDSCCARSPTSHLYCKSRSNPEDPAIKTDKTCDHCLSTQMTEISVEDTDIPNNKTFADSLGSTDVLTSTPDSWRSKDNTRDSVDTQRLTAY